MLFDEQSPSDGPRLLEVPKDRSLDLEAAVSELLLKAVTGRDFLPRSWSLFSN
jgi:hypothetical protein